MKISQEVEDVRRPAQKKALILHGWGSSLESWIPVKNLLEDQGYQVFIPELPGFGKTPPPKTPWRIDNYAEWVKSFCENQIIAKTRGELVEPFFLIGHSFGGGIALKFAVRYPQKVSSLVLVAPAILRQRKLRQYIYFPFSKIGKFVFSLPILVFFQPLMRKIFYRFLGVSDYYKLEAGVMKETFKEIIREDLQEFLPKISCRTLIVWGKQDKVTPLQDAYIIKEKILNSQLIILSKVGHSPQIDAPEKLAEIILQFVKS